MTLPLRVAAVRQEAATVRSFELVATDGAALPPFDAGAHIDLRLQAGLVRSYSLANSPGETTRYLIAVHREVAGRGGSAWLHESVREGDILEASAPRNHFPLVEAAPHTVLVAGGIGITPIRAMVLRLRALRRPWTLYYAGRVRHAMAYLDEFEALAGEDADVRVHVDADSGRTFDMACVPDAVAGSHFYCCGPAPMIAAFQAALAGLPAGQVHVEHFCATAPAASGGFRVELVKSGRAIDVPVGCSLLDALLDAGMRIPYSCMDGVCGSCETRVVSGVPDHRDAFLTDAQKLAGDRMMVCCSGARSAVLGLDL